MINSKNRYILIALSISIILLLGMYACVLWHNSLDQQAYADYEDVVNDNTAIVNFNQVVNYSELSSTAISFSTDHFVLNGTFVANDWIFSNIYANLDNSHKYYFYVKQDNPVVEVVFDGTQLRNTGLYIGQPTQSIQSPLYFKTTQALTLTNYSIYFYCIDLTLMFGGNDNIPNVQQCQELFVSNYYPYNTGSPVSLSGLDSYALGYSDALNSSEYVFNESLLRSMIFLNTGYKLWGSTSSQDIGVQVANNSVSGSGSLGINLPSPLSQGDTLTIEALRLSAYTTSAVADSSYRPDIFVGYYSNGAFVSLGQFNMSYNNNPNIFIRDNVYEQFYKDVTITINIPTDISTIYINSNCDFYFMSPDIKASTLNVVYAIDSAYNNGYNRAKDTYEQQLQTYYGTDGVGGSNYEAIWEEAYQSGLNANVSEARKKTYTFTAFLGALFDVPVQTLKSLLDFNFLGFNLKNFVFSLLTMTIVFAIIRLILVKTGDKS